MWWRVKVALAALLLLRWSRSDGVLAIGVNYGMKGDNLPPPPKVAELLRTTCINSVKLYNADAEVLSALANSGITVIIGVENELIPALAKSTRAARIWVSQHILPYYPATVIVAVAVGNEVLTGTNTRLLPLLVPAMSNLYSVLQQASLEDKIKISTPTSMSALTISSPPSAARFAPPILPYVSSLLKFLSQTGSPLFMNVYPYFAYANEPKSVSLDFALFDYKPGIKDPHTGLAYGSLFDAQVDAVHFAVKAAGFNVGIPVWISETGWPSGGDANETAATVRNAQIYTSNLVKRVESGVGTPLMPRIQIPTYIFALFNENQKPGPGSERNFGLFKPNSETVYEAGIVTNANTAAGGAPVNGGNAGGAPVNGGNAGGPTGVWCVAAPGATDDLLKLAIDFACGDGEADCAPIQNGQPCFTPNTLAAHASFAMNSYYQRHGRNYWNCYFNSTALVTVTNPSYGTCTYPSQ